MKFKKIIFILILMFGLFTISIIKPKAATEYIETITIEGTYKFNETIEMPSFTPQGYFNNSSTFAYVDYMHFEIYNNYYLDYAFIDEDGFSDEIHAYNFSTNEWYSSYDTEVLRTITFPKQEINKETFEWLTANAVYQDSYYLEGLFYLNSTLTKPSTNIEQSIEFKANNPYSEWVNYVNTGFKVGHFNYLSFIYNDQFEGDGESYSFYSFSSNTYSDSSGNDTSACRNIEFTSKQSVSSDFYNWFVLNTKKIKFSGYTINFESNDDEVYDSLESQSTIPSNLPTPSKIGYSFDGWYYDQSMNNKVNSGDSLSSDITLYAKFIPNIYKIYYYYSLNDYLNDPSSYITNVEAYYEDSISYLTSDDFKSLNFTLYENNYIKGYYQIIDNQLSEEYYNFVSMPAEDLLLIADYVPLYTITFETQIDGISCESVSTYETISELPTPSKDGFIFEGWYYDINLNDKVNLGDPLNSNITLYANWLLITYTITFEVNGGSMISALTEQLEVPLELPSPTKTHYIFEGWYLDSELTNPVVLGSNLFEDIVLYAKYIGEMHFIYYYPDLDTRLNDPSAYMYREQFNYNDNYTLLDDDKIILIPEVNQFFVGKSLKGWKQLISDNPITIPDDYISEGIITSDIILFATYELIEYTYSFKENIDSVDVIEIKGNYEDIIEYPTFIKDGYRFIGYKEVYTDDILSENLYDSQVFEARNVNLVASFIKTYIVSFVIYEGTPINDLEVIDMSELPVPSKQNYVFEGWYYDELFEQKVYSEDSIDADTTVYAKYLKSTSVNLGSSSATFNCEEFNLESFLQSPFSIVLVLGFLVLILRKRR